MQVCYSSHNENENKVDHFSQNFLLEEDKTINFAYQNIFNQIFNRL